MGCFIAAQHRTHTAITSARSESNRRFMANRQRHAFQVFRIFGILWSTRWPIDTCDWCDEDTWTRESVVSFLVSVRKCNASKISISIGDGSRQGMCMQNVDVCMSTEYQFWNSAKTNWMSLHCIIKLLLSIRLRNGAQWIHAYSFSNLYDLYLLPLPPAGTLTRRSSEKIGI